MGHRYGQGPHDLNRLRCRAGRGRKIAPAIVHDLAGSDEVERMLLLHLDGERAAAVARERGGEKATSRTADATDEDALARLLDDVDVLVNTASYRVNLHAMKAYLAVGCPYLDLGGLYWDDRPPARAGR